MQKNVKCDGQRGTYKVDFEIDDNGSMSPTVMLYKKRRVLFWSRWQLIYLRRIRKHIFTGGYNFNKYSDKELKEFAEKVVEEHERVTGRNDSVESLSVEEVAN